MTDPNVYTPEWEIDSTASPLKMRALTLGTLTGSQRPGASIYELLPGGAAAPFHLHLGNEELLVVLGGRPLLRAPDGVRRLHSGDVVAFFAGPAGAHRVSNPGPRLARVLIVSTMSFPDVLEYPQIGATMILAAPALGADLLLTAFPPAADADFRSVFHAAIEADLQLDAMHDDGPDNE